MEEGVSRLVYTSTYNVVFGGQEIRNGDSTLPYLPADKHVDHYSKTKSLAEQQVRAASGKGLGGDCTILKTCALRCAGIYGKGEQRHFPRIVVRDVRFTTASMHQSVIMMHLVPAIRAFLSKF